MFAPFFNGDSLMLVGLKAREQTLGYSEQGRDRAPVSQSELTPLRLTQFSPIETPQKTQNIPRRVTNGAPTFIYDRFGGVGGVSPEAFERASNRGL